MKNVCEKLMGKAAEKPFCCLCPSSNFLWWLAHRSTYTTKISVNSGQYSSNTTTQDLTNIKLNHWPFSNTPSHTKLAFLLISSLRSGAGATVHRMQFRTFTKFAKENSDDGSQSYFQWTSTVCDFYENMAKFKRRVNKTYLCDSWRDCRIDGLCKCPCIYHLCKSKLSKY
jgi:hypothetical protein